MFSAAMLYVCKMMGAWTLNMATNRIWTSHRLGVVIGQPTSLSWSRWTCHRSRGSVPVGGRFHGSANKNSWIMANGACCFYWICYCQLMRRFLWAHSTKKQIYTSDTRAERGSILKWKNWCVDIFPFMLLFSDHTIFHFINFTAIFWCSLLFFTRKFLRPQNNCKIDAWTSTIGYCLLAFYAPYSVAYGWII